MIPEYLSKRVNYLLICIVLTVVGISGNANAQTIIFAESFGQNLPPLPCDKGTLANNYVTANGTWTVTSLGTNDSAASEWYISATEPGLIAGNCSQAGCNITPGVTNRSLHVGNVINSPNAITGAICPTADCGAVYDPGGFQTAVQTDKRAESPAFPMPANSTNVLVFDYVQGGEAGHDFVDVVFYNGSAWVPVTLLPVSDTLGCGGTFAKWNRYSVQLPSTFTNNVKIGFEWINDNGGVGSSPSFAVDSIVVYSISNIQANISVSDTDICANTCVDFTADTVGAGALYTWLFNGSSTPTSTTQSPAGICYPSPGTYQATLIVTIPPTSIFRDSVLITVNPCVPPTADFVASDSDFCERDCITFTDLSIDGATGWNWFFPGGIPSTSTSPTPPPICYNTPGTYDVTLIAFNQFGADTLVKTAYLLVNVCPLPIADFNSTVTQLCPQHCVSFADNSQFGPILTYQWYFPGGIPDTSTAANPTICYDQEGLYDVELIVSNQYGSDTILKYSEVSAQFVNGAFASPDTAMFFGSNYQMNAGGGVSYVWSPAAGLTDTSGVNNPTLIPNPVASPLSTTTYTVLITDAAGCTAMRQVTIEILHNNNVFVPNSFSPNNDGANDYLVVRGNNLYGVSLVVFDRWGEKIFESTNQFPGWDGTYNGKELDPGVFTYIAKVNYSDKETVTETGSVTLVR